MYWIFNSHRNRHHINTILQTSDEATIMELVSSEDGIQTRIQVPLHCTTLYVQKEHHVRPVQGEEDTGDCSQYGHNAVC